MRKEELDQPMLVIPYIKAKYLEDVQSYNLIKKFGDLEVFKGQDHIFQDFLVKVVVSRNLYIFDKLKKIKDDFEQVLVLSAGLDTKIDILDYMDDKLAIGLDIASKDIENIYKFAGLSTKLNIIQCDLSRDVNFKLLSKLQELEFNKEKKTLLLWEGGTFHISKADVNHVLSFLSENINISHIYADYMNTDVFYPPKNRDIEQIIRIQNEHSREFQSYYSPEEVYNLYRSLGYESIEIVDTSNYRSQLPLLENINEDISFFTFASK